MTFPARPHGPDKAGPGPARRFAGLPPVERRAALALRLMRVGRPARGCCSCNTGPRLESCTMGCPVGACWLPYGGLYISGGIAAKNPEWGQSKDFLNAYNLKGEVENAETIFEGCGFLA